MNANNTLNALKRSDIKYLQSKGLFKSEEGAFARTLDGGPAGVTPYNNVLPLGLLSKLSPMMVEIITRERTGEEVIGSKMKVLDWQENDLYTPAVELLGETKPYDDFDNGPASSVNPQFISRGHYRFSSKVQVGDLSSAQLSIARISQQERGMAATLEALAIEMNNVAFFGTSKPAGSAYPVYGIFNEPSLPAYKEAGFTQSNATFDNIYAELKGMIQEVIAQSQGKVKPTSNFRFSMSNAHNSILAITNQLGTDTLISILKKTYPNIEFTFSPEMDTAYNDLPTLYLKAEVPEVANVAPTAIIGFSEMALSSRVEVHTSSTEQKVSSGTVGAIVLKPYFWSRRYISA